MARKKDSPQKAALRELMGNYLKENNVKVKDGTDVNSIMRDMMSIIYTPFSARLIRLFIRYSGRRPSYIILSSPYTCAQLRIVLVHFFVASNVARYSAFNRAVSLGNTLLWRFSFR